LKPVGFVIQEVLLDIEPQAIFLERLAIGWFIAAHIPIVVTLPRSSHNQRHWPIALCRDLHLECMSPTIIQAGVCLWRRSTQWAGWASPCTGVA